MIQIRSVLNAADNSGARHLRVLHVHGGSRRRFGSIGTLVTCAVDKAEPDAFVKDSQLVKAIVVRTRKECRRADGSYIRFDDNAAVVLEALTSKNPVGTRIFGPVAREIKDLGYNKIVSLAKEVW